MIICHCTTVHPRDDVRILHKQCTSLAKLGYKIYLLVADGKGDELRDGVEIIDLGNYRKQRIKRVRVAGKLVFKKALMLQADIYHLHDPELLGIGKKLKKNGQRIVYDSHEDVPKQILYKSWLGPIWMRRLISNIYNNYEKKIVQQFDGLVSVIDEITDKFICKNKITIKNFPLVKQYEPYVVPFNEKSNQIIYVGSLSKERGIKDCIKAMGFLPDNITLTLIGSFSNTDFQKECEQLEEWKNVDYKGYLKITEIAPLIAMSKVGLCVLHPEENYKMSIPTKGFEYLAAGTPIVLSDFDYWRPYFTGCGYFVKPGSPKLIADAVIEIMSNEKNYIELQSVGQKRAEENSWEFESKKLQSFYKSIVTN